MQVFSHQIIIGAGTEYLYGLLIQLLGKNLIYGVENPGYHKIGKICKSMGVTYRHVDLDESGVSEGYKKVLMIVGVGYKAVKQGNKLMLYLGHSLMPVTGLPQDKFIMEDTDTVKLEVPSEDEIKKQGIDKLTTEKISSSLIIVVKGVDKQEVGQTAAVIRGKRPPEPYHGKGVRYINESVRRKVGKTGK